jgi:hypothetical protein
MGHGAKTTAAHHFSASSRLTNLLYYNIDKYEIDILSNHETFLQSKKVSEAGSAVREGGSSSHKENDCVQMSGFNASATSDIAYNAIVETVAHAKDNPKKASASHRSAVVSTKVGAHGGEAEILLTPRNASKRLRLWKNP